MTKKDEVTLALNQNANAGECGSCKFFVRNNEFSEWIARGDCKFRLPPTREFSRVQWDGDSMPLSTVQDTQGCDFWQSSGKTFIISRRVAP